MYIIVFVFKKIKIFSEFIFYFFTLKYDDENKINKKILNFNSETRIDPVCKFFNYENDSIIDYNKEKKIFYKNLFSSEKKIILLKDGSDLINFFFLKNLTFDIYDTVKGNNKNRFEELIESFCIKRKLNLIHRDLRISKLYKKKFYKPRIYIPDLYQINKFQNTVNYKSFKHLKILSVGWIDSEDVSIEDSINFFCSKGSRFDIYLSNLNKKNYLKKINYYKKCYGNLINFFEFVPRLKLIKIIQTYNFGICPHDSILKKNFKIKKDYYETCSSTRLSDYSFGKLDIILSKKYRFQHRLAKKLNLRVLLTENYNKIKDVHDMNKYLN